MQCFEVPVDEDERGEPIPCAGRKFQVTGRAHYAPNATYSVSTQLQWDALDDQRYDDKFRQDLSAWVIGTVKPAEELRMRARVRYLFEDISDNGYLEQSLWTYLDFSYKLRERDTLRLRYDLFWWLDDRANTLDRVPSPEHWLWLEVQSRF
jgi:hypothetical protein